jgi:RNA polymerase sigma factor (TIGR02999 family)
MAAEEDITEVLRKVSAGDSQAAETLFAQVYGEFRRIARSFLATQRAEHTLQPTALVNEAYLKLVDQSRIDWKDRSHFFAVGSMAMRQVLVNHAVAKNTQKRGGGAIRVELDDQLVSPERDYDILAVDEALQELAQHNAGYAKIVECRFFGGLSWDETAEALGMSATTVRRQWTFCSAWLRERLAR